MLEIGKQIRSQQIDAIQVRKHMKNQSLEILSITLEKGSVLPDHTSPRDAFLIVLEGKLDFLIDGKTFHLQKFEDFSFPKERTHRVVAREDTRFLIIR